MEMNLNSLSFGKVFPLMSMADDILVSKRGDITIGWSLTMPAAYTAAQQDYDNFVTVITDAARMLPPWTIIHKQDMFIRREYRARSSSSFLSRAFERHFDHREYLDHRCCLYLTFSSKKRVEGHSKSLFGDIFNPPDISSKDFAQLLRAALDAAKDFEDTLKRERMIGIRRLTTEDFGEPRFGYGILHDYCFLGSDETSDYSCSPEEMVIGDSHLVSYTLSRSSQFLSSDVENCVRAEQMSTSLSDIYLSGGSAFGIGLDCEHILNQYIVIYPQQEFHASLERKRKEMQSMSLSSKENLVNLEQINEFQREVYDTGLQMVGAHMNVLAWGSAEQIPDIRALVAAAFQQSGLSVHRNRFDTPCLFLAGIPGAASELDKDDWYSAEIGSAVCTWSFESFQSNMSGGSLKLCDRNRLIPVTADIHLAAKALGMVDNFNAFVFGPSGSGKSFFMNKILRDSYDAGASVFIMDVSDSYEGLASIIRDESGGQDGTYYAHDPKHPFSFNPFAGCLEWLDIQDDEEEGGLAFLLSILKQLWHPEHIGWTADAVNILTDTVLDFVRQWKGDADPVFDDYFVYMNDVVVPLVNERRYCPGGVPVSAEDFRFSKFINAIKSYARSGRFGFLLNGKDDINLFSGRFTVFEVDKASGQDFYPLWLLCIMHAFEEKMRHGDGLKLMVIDEAWKAIANEYMAPYIAWLWRTARKFRTGAVVVTQSIDDVVSSEVIKGAIIDNSNVKAILSLEGNLPMATKAQEMLALSDHDRNLLLSTGRGKKAGRIYKEVFLSYAKARSAVYAYEVSPEEVIVYESEKEKKKPFIELSQQVGAIEAVKRLVSQSKK